MLRALAESPRLLLMDEPFGAIDPITRDRLQNEFLRLQEELKKTIVFVTHSLGGILVRGYAAQHPDPRVSRVVMLSPPNKGSEVVDILDQVEAFGRIVADGRSRVIHHKHAVGVHKFHRAFTAHPFLD